MAIDIYCWLTHRMFYLQKPTEIPWPLLQLQFGADYDHNAQGLRNFKYNFLKHLKNVCVIYPQAHVGEGERGLALKPSPPHVAPLPEPPRVGPPPPLLLRTATYEKASKAAPGFDVYPLEQDWRDWLANKEPPKDPEVAFIGFCKQFHLRLHLSYAPMTSSSR